MDVGLNAYDILTKSLKAKVLINYFDVACMTLWTLEYIQLFGLEVQFMWPLKWDLVNTLFYVLRYLPPIHLSMSFAFFYLIFPQGQKLCEYIFIVNALFTPIHSACAEAVMFIRIYAIGGRTRTLKYYTICHYIISHTAIYSLVIMFCTTLINDSPLIQYIGCNAIVGDGKYLSIIYGIILFNEFAMAILTLATAFRKYSYSKDIPLLKIFYLDGTMYFMGLVGISAGNVFLNIFVPEPYNYTLATIQHVLHSIFTTRMSLKLRHTASIQPCERFNFNLNLSTTASLPHERDRTT